MAGPYLYDWMGYNGQPDLRPLGLVPVMDGMNGVFNRATVPEADNTPGVAPLAQVLPAATRIGTAAAGVAPLTQAVWRRPRAYDNLPQDVVFDLESEPFWLKAQISAPKAGRVQAFADLAAVVAEIKASAARQGRAIRVGAYAPEGPFNYNFNTNDPNFSALEAEAGADAKPYLDSLDFVAAELSMMDTNVDNCLTRAAAWMARHERWTPGRPFIAEMQLCYAHEMSDANPLKWSLPPLPDYLAYVEGVLKMGVAGVMLFGNLFPLIPGGTGVGVPGDTWQLDYTYVRAHVEAVAGLVKRYAAMPAPPAPRRPYLPPEGSTEWNAIFGKKQFREPGSRGSWYQQSPGKPGRRRTR